MRFAAKNIMDCTLTTARTAGAQAGCALPPAPLPGMGSHTLQVPFQPVFRRDLERALRATRKDLGLSGSDLAVLIALLSFLPCRANGAEIPISNQLLLTVFASNAAICDRAGGLEDRTLRRAFVRLVKAELIVRRDSANGKRFARRAQGKVVAAFGIDVSPLLVRGQQIIDAAARKAEQAQELKGLVAEAKALRAHCAALDWAAPALQFLDGLGAVLRRTTLTLAAVRAIIARLKGMLSSQHKPKGTAPASATDGQNVRHKETNQTDSYKTLQTAWDEAEELKAYYPTPPRTARDLIRTLMEFAKLLGLDPGQVQRHLSTAGPAAIIAIFNEMVVKIASITNPRGFFESRLARMGSRPDRCAPVLA